MRSIHIATPKPYDVHIGGGLLARTGEVLRSLFPPCCVAIVTDSMVDARYGDRVQKSLEASGFSTLRYAFPAGESNKTWQTLGAVLDYLAENRMTRGDLILALGGGVPGDMAGFAAAVYERGIRYVQVPTTLLAAVDASVGGKTAVDLAMGKNLVGAFHQPSLVLTDTEVIRALPPNRLSDGAAEVIKAGVIADEALFQQMSRPGWQEALDAILARSVEIKRTLVEQDERDCGVRQLLNLGHTFGHALEKCSGFSLSHGQGVAVGMLLSACAANQQTVVCRLAAALDNCGLPVHCAYAADRLAEAALSDKKRQGDTLSLVLPMDIGRCVIEKIAADMLPAVFETACRRLKAWVG